MALVSHAAELAEFFGKAYCIMDKLETKLGQPSWRLKSDDVEAYVTQTGGHIGPVTFQLGRRQIQPYSVAPWAAEAPAAKSPAVLRALRGDFFCLPFGGNAKPFRGERHPVHGETANARWKLESASPGELHLSLKTRIREGRVDKHVFLRPGQTAVYQRHIISGMSGPMNLGHHAMLKFPDSGGVVSTSRIAFGQVLPTRFEQPEQGGYSALKVGARFRSLQRVALAGGGHADLTRYPARRGFEDLVMMVSEAAQPLAWTAVTFAEEGYVWFALKDPRVLRQTVFWISNGGRHYAPWNGRHVNVLGLEEVTSYFHHGLAESAGRNPLSAQGIPTCLRLNPNQPLKVNYVMAVAVIPKGFDRVAAITPAKNHQSVRLTALSGSNIDVPLDLSFLEITRLKPKAVLRTTKR